uniref:Binding n=1 Tax=Arundo donax TaxID=35708 RepID=A0A0A9FBR5_ARUDO
MTDRLETSYNIGKTLLKYPGSLNAVTTLCKHKKASSRYTFDFLLHAAQTAFCITFGKLESSAVIAA